jgi:phosphonate transport system substrate-binding protein
MNLKVPLTVFIFTLVLLTFSFLTYAQPPQKEITIGLIPEINIFRQSKKYELLGSYLTSRTGIKVNFTMFNQYGDSIDLYLGRKLDGAFFGSFTAVLALDKLEIELLVSQLNMNGANTSHGYLFVRKDSGIKGFKNLKGRVMVYVDKATFTGYVFPIAYLRENGVTDTDNFFSEYYFAGSHDFAIMEVLNGKADIGAAKNTVYDSLAKENPRIKRELLIIAESSEVTSIGLSLNNNIDSTIREQLLQALLSMDKDPEGKKVLIELGHKGYIENTRNDNRGLLNIIDNVGIKIRSYDYYNW